MKSISSRCGDAFRAMAWALLLVFLSACTPRQMIVQGIADELARQGQVMEDDLVLAREAGAFYLKLAEALLREAPDNPRLAEAVAGGFTQYAYAFVAGAADRIEVRDVKAARDLRVRAARLYRRARDHALTALERQAPGFAAALAAPDAARWPKISGAQVGIAYWAAAAWGGSISLSKDDPDSVADLPLAIRLARLAWEADPDYGDGALASLMGTFEAARPGGSRALAATYFDRAIALGGGAGAYVAKAEAIARAEGDRAGFERLLRQALAASAARRDVPNTVMGERAQWLLDSADDLF